MEERLYVDGNILAVRSASGTDLTHCATINIGALGPRTYSLGSRCGVGHRGDLRALGLWLERDNDWRRCKKCVAKEDARILLEIEWGGKIPRRAIRLNPNWRPGGGR